MTHDPELVAETRSWLVRGKMDLDAAAFELTAVPPLPKEWVTSLVACYNIVKSRLTRYKIVR